MEGGASTQPIPIDPRERQMPEIEPADARSEARPVSHSESTLPIPRVEATMPIPRVDPSEDDE
jgi:hypothetical protein